MSVSEAPLILIVDDDPKSLQLLGNLLRAHGYKPTITRSGADALKFVAKRQPACILLDIIMPGMDGMETCRHLKTDERSRDIPVIFLTGVTDTWNKVRAFEAGGVDYITKPFEAEEVLVRVATHSRMRRMQLQLQAQNAQLQQEIRERRMAEISLRRLEEAINTTQIGVTIANPDGHIIYTNPADARMHGYTVEELLGKPSAMFAPPERRSLTTRTEASHAQLHNWERESINVRRDGSWFPVKLLSNTIYDAAGSVIGTVTICEDITERKRNEEALQDARRMADAANQAKSMFLATMSHELRTPLNGILGYAQILRHSHRFAGDDLRSIETIEESGNHLLTLINDVLDLSKIEAGKVELNPEPFSLPGLLLTVSTMIRVKAQRKGLQFSEARGPGLPSTVVGDETRLRQVLLNLLGNAVKFTERGSVTFSVQCADPAPTAGESAASLQFSIRDTGIGIAKEHLSGLFQPFQQVHDRLRNVEGTGLGLSISANIVALMGGRIEVESEPGQGCHFWFDVELPVIASTLKPPSEPSRRIVGVVGPPPKIFIIDDSPVNARVLHDMLAPLGFTLAQAADAEDALRQLAEFQPDLVVLDIRMPGMDGFDLARTIRERAAESLNPARTEPKLIACSASVFEDTRQRSMEAGCDDFLSKPVRRDDLLAMLTAHVPITWQYEEAAAPAEGDAAVDAMTLPALDVLRDLEENAAIGDINHLAEHVERLRAQDAAFGPFVESIQALLNTFQIERLHAELTRILQHAERCAADEDV